MVSAGQPQWGVWPEPSDLAGPIEGQLSGWWIAPWEEPPSSAPAIRHGGAILVRGGQTTATEARALDLVPFDDAWLVLSEAGLYTYRHSEGLARGERWRLFVPGRRLSDPPQIFEAHLSPARLSRSALAEHYGDEAARRARPDRDSIELVVRRVP